LLISVGAPNLTAPESGTSEANAHVFASLNGMTMNALVSVPIVIRPSGDFVLRGDAAISTGDDLMVVVSRLHLVGSIVAQPSNFRDFASPCARPTSEPLSTEKPLHDILTGVAPVIFNKRFLSTLAVLASADFDPSLNGTPAINQLADAELASAAKVIKTAKPVTRARLDMIDLLCRCRSHGAV
jgi:hypothetical protein